jgi:hypothetical protein
MQKADDGDWVLYEDYARLKAEVERLKAFTTRTIIPNEELQAQVERLTLAGDELGEWFMDIHPSKKKWNAAKEGKGQS